MTTHDDAPTVFDQPFWDNLYTERAMRWSGNANPVLVTEASKLEPGTALDIGSGEGGDAFWLADNGWTTTGSDISVVALDRARQAQGERTIEWLHRDLLEWAPESSYDLVTAHFFQLPPLQVGPAFTRFGNAVAAGGHLLIVGHSPNDAMASQHQHAEMLFGVDSITSLFDGDQWTTVVAEDRVRAGNNPDGSHGERIDTVVLLRRQ
ncbi:class I SAM-dependent methyltransferase [Rhodococcus sp. G-MC3]|uniref:class I SAM-dependent methyltransferase n=1 Tax=Rhodococcus sp. G-MC3 TaxID=3046209 RepID=UPI0024B9B1F1|nr:class I SAM-dependent methyltransferase [Rhodococcus sp. G-MC3]MDJ0396314.1 class I SAM-dependent methyltransferase [Rhodococcus sp. G-MC3]